MSIVGILQIGNDQSSSGRIATGNEVRMGIAG